MAPTGLPGGTSGRVCRTLGKLLENKVPTAVAVHILSLPGQRKMQVPKPGTDSLEHACWAGLPWPVSDLSLDLVLHMKNAGADCSLEICILGLTTSDNTQREEEKEAKWGGKKGNGKKSE